MSLRKASATKFPAVMHCELYCLLFDMVCCSFCLSYHSRVRNLKLKRIGHDNFSQFAAFSALPVEISIRASTRARWLLSLLTAIRFEHYRTLWLP